MRTGFLGTEVDGRVWRPAVSAAESVGPVLSCKTRLPTALLRLLPLPLHCLTAKKVDFLDRYRIYDSFRPIFLSIFSSCQAGDLGCECADAV